MTDQRTAAVGRFLDREVPETYLHEWTRHVAAAKETRRVGTQSVLIFRIAEEWVALPTTVFQEATGEGAIRKLPGRRDQIVRGLVNVRGELLVCVSLAVLLGLRESAELNSASPTRLLICRHSTGPVAFPVSEIDGVHRYHPSELRPAPATVTAAAAGAFVSGILPWKDTCVGVLNDELLFYALNKGLA